MRLTALLLSLASLLVIWARRAMHKRAFWWAGRPGWERATVYLDDAPVFFCVAAYAGNPGWVKVHRLQVPEVKPGQAFDAAAVLEKDQIGKPRLFLLRGRVEVKCRATRPDSTPIPTSSAE
jgi:hypothetical protein